MRVPSIVGVRAVGVLRERSGPIIEDRALHTMTWLVPRGSAADWDPAALGVLVLMRGLPILVPPADAQGHAEAVWWLIPPTATCLTDPDALLDVLEQVR
ncbi:hypothetical protein [Streptomyces johnsoniae]|uniref:hypothetical protein n=1 Tax=Streptomyces johnsoniae TaxID=3075532 RepID=UPI00288B72DD|nr:hypothetical protein [Streptomyces sp. DSM 41886]